MRPTFVILSNGELVSAIRKKGEQHALRIGLRLELAYSYETDYGTVPAGARGVVKAVDEDDGTTWILMEGIEPALFHWDNMLVISPHQTEELLTCIRLSIDKRLSEEELLAHGSHY
jgi:hypothetical protein